MSAKRVMGLESRSGRAGMPLTAAVDLLSLLVRVNVYLP